MHSISVIIPLFNEQENVDWLVGELNAFFANSQEYTAEVLFVNDGSSDRTLARLRKANHRSYQHKIISFSRNFGSHAALRAGVLHAEGDFVTFMYADLQDPLELIRRMYAELKRTTADICWACRIETGTSKRERLFSQTYASLMRRFAVPNYPQRGFDIVMFDRKVATCLNENIEANSSLFIQILNLGFGQSTITYNKRPRHAGKSKWTLSKKVKLLIDSFVAFSFAPIRLVSLIGIAFFLFGIGWTAYIIGRKLLFDDLASGWPALVSILTLGFGITNISLGIIAEYLWRTLDASRKRPVFVIDEIITAQGITAGEARIMLSAQ